MPGLFSGPCGGVYGGEGANSGKCLQDNGSNFRPTAIYFNSGRGCMWGIDQTSRAIYGLNVDGGDLAPKH